MLRKLIPLCWRGVRLDIAEAALAARAEAETCCTLSHPQSSSRLSSDVPDQVCKSAARLRATSGSFCSTSSPLSAVRWSTDSLRAYATSAASARRKPARAPVQEAAAPVRDRSAAASPQEAEQPTKITGVKGGVKTANPPPGAHYRPQQMKISLVSPNMIAEPYKGEPPPLPWSSWVTLGGWRERKTRFLGGAKSMYTLSKCRKHLKPFALADFKAEALKVYEAVCRSIALGDLASLRQLVTPAEFSIMKRQVKAREGGGWLRVDWAFAQKPQLSDMEAVHGRMIMVNPQDETSAFAQITLRVRSRQRFSAFNAQNELVAGDAEADFPVQDVWVFERSLKQKDPLSSWRIAGRLSLPPVAPPKPSVLLRVLQAIGLRRSK